jgi:predicted transcriptional regulator
MTEYLDITRSNRTRIAALLKANSQRTYAKTRIRSRMEMQDAWEAGLDSLMAAIDEGQEVTTLYEYMHGV